MAEKTEVMALLAKLAGAHFKGIDWEALSADEQGLATQLEGSLVDIQPRGWRSGPGDPGGPTAERHVLSSIDGRIQVLLPILDELLRPGVREVTKMQVLAACAERGLPVHAPLLDDLIQCLDSNNPENREDPRRIFGGFVVELRPGEYVFQRG